MNIYLEKIAFIQSATSLSTRSISNFGKKVAKIPKVEKVSLSTKPKSFTGSDVGQLSHTKRKDFTKMPSIKQVKATSQSASMKVTK